MEIIIKNYTEVEEKILKKLKNNGIKHRTKSSPGLWLGPLIGLSFFLTYLKEDNSYSEICLLLGISGAGLIISCLCLYSRLVVDNSPAKDFHIIYFLPSILLSTMYLLIVNKGLLISVLWGLIAGSLSTWGVIQAMSRFPGCFTLGEATAVMHGIVLFLLSTLTNLPLRYHLPPIHDSDIATAILQVVVLYIMFICLACLNFPRLCKPLPFYLFIIVILLSIVLPSLHIILDQSPILWVINFLFDETNKIYLFTFWLICLTNGFLSIIYQIQINSHASTSMRKIFHILAVIVYIPGLLFQPAILYLASGVILGIFLMLEILRKLQLPPFNQFLQSGFLIFADEKDSLISLSPLYLLSGLSVILWLPTENLEILPLMSGVLSIGLGDTAASIIGSKWGKHKWKGSTKSIEGTLACILVQAIAIFALASLGLIENNYMLVRSILAVIIVSLVEARTEQIDNLALPFLMYVCLII